MEATRKMDLRLFDVEKGGVKEKGGVVEMNEMQLDRIKLENVEGGVEVIMGLELHHAENELEQGGVKEKGGDEGGVDVLMEPRTESNFNNLHTVIIEDDEGGVDVAMGPEFDKIETKVEEGGVMESSGVAEGAMNKMNFEDDEGGVDDVLMGPEFDQFKTEVEKGGVKEQGGVAERIKSKFNNLHNMIEDDEGGVDVVMGPEFEKNDMEIEEGGVMIKDNEKGGVDVENRLKFKRIKDDMEIKEGGVMGKDNEKGGVDVKNRFTFNMIGDDIEIEEGGVMGIDNEKGGVDVENRLKFNMIGDDIEIEEEGVKEQGGVIKRALDIMIFDDDEKFDPIFGLSKRNIKRGEGSVRKRKNSNHFTSNQEDQSSINSFFSRRKRSRFNFVIDEEQANEHEILENHNEFKVDQNEMLQKKSEFRVNQSQNQSHINPSFSINENINGGEGRVQSS
ncbi:hypothetical protein ROZALSC1DRAFT_25632, partial [Rozella allomycis CSF55]